MTLFKEGKALSDGIMKLVQQYEDSIEIWRQQYSKLLKYKCSYKEDGKCSNCKTEAKNEYIYCPHCGAKIVDRDNYNIYCQMFGGKE